MEAASERRLPGDRIPLAGLIELALEDFDEPFEADAVNLGPGGISMRAPYLPDVGARMVCRFACGPAGPRVEADAEVVWAQDSGQNLGEFGLRFLALADGAQAAIHSALRGRSVYLPPSPPSASPPSAVSTLIDVDAQAELAPEKREPSRVSLTLDGVRSAISAKVVHSDHTGLALEQDLPFLELAKGVTLSPGGRRGRIVAVELSIEDDVPRLLLDIAYDDISDTTATGGIEVSDSTLVDYASPSAIETSAIETSPIEAEPQGPDTEPGIPERVTRDTVIVSGDDPLELAAESSAGSLTAALQGAVETLARPEAETTVEPDDDDVRIVRTARAADVEELAQEEDRTSAVALDDPALALPRSEAREAFARAAADFTKLLALAIQYGKKASMRLAPALATAWAATKKAAAWVAEKAGPFARSATKKARAGVGTASVLVRQKVGRSKKRRTTATPPAESNLPTRRRRSKKAVARKQPKIGRRIVVLAVIATGIALGAWALWPSADGEVEEATSGTEVTNVESAAANPLPELADPENGDYSYAAPSTAVIGGAAPAPQPVAAPAAAVPAAVPAAAPRTPLALGEPSRQAGHMPAPTFPSADRAAQAPGTLPEGSPYAAQVPSDAPTAQPQATVGGSFGAADVPNGRSYSLRMSQPVSTIQGTPTQDGVQILIPGALSLDRAGPIAASHPLVERSMILNRGDHSILTIVFVEGQSPAYRIAARGSSVEVLIARR